MDSKKISNWKRKILDRDIVSERQEFIVHPAYIVLDIVKLVVIILIG